MDDEGYLALNNVGRVLGKDGPIRITSEDFGVSNQGVISVRIEPEPTDDEDYGYDDEDTEPQIEVLGTLRIVDFADYEQLHKEDYGLFSTGQAPQEVEMPALVWQSLEKSNVDMVEEMTAMMTSQRALQSAAQVLKMYDQIMSKASTDVGRL